MATSDPTGLYLIIEAIPGAAGLERTRAALAAGPVASVLITAHTERPLDASGARPYVDLIQAAGVAALIDGDAALARTLRADGVHLRASPGVEVSSDVLAGAYADAREIVGARFIVGAEAGGTRHGAMELGELGAEYVAFGGPDTADLVEWWAEIFEVPCVAFGAASPEDAARLARLGADFVACTVPSVATPADVAERVRAFAAALADRGHALTSLETST